MNDPPISVLIVDDSALMRKIVSQILYDERDINVVGSARNGLFALNKLEKLSPDIIILDLEMPEMNGIEFLKERKKRGIDIPVVILSSLAREGARITMEALFLGASDFILKPIGTQDNTLRETQKLLVEKIRVFGPQDF